MQKDNWHSVFLKYIVAKVTEMNIFARICKLRQSGEELQLFDQQPGLTQMLFAKANINPDVTLGKYRSISGVVTLIQRLLLPAAVCGYFMETY